MKLTKGHCGTVVCQGVSACVAVGDVDLILTGGVVLPAVLTQHGPVDTWVDSIVRDDGTGQTWTGEVPDDTAREALYLAACAEVLR